MHERKKRRKKKKAAVVKLAGMLKNYLNFLSYIQIARSSSMPCREAVVYWPPEEIISVPITVPSFPWKNSSCQSVRVSASSLWPSPQNASLHQQEQRMSQVTLDPFCNCKANNVIGYFLPGDRKNKKLQPEGALRLGKVPSGSTM